MFEMEREPSPEVDDDFSDVYKEYTGPPGLNTTTVQETAKVNKMSHASSDEEEEPCDSNAVPTNFTSREAKVWEAKSKVTERNCKKKKEEMICKICGESGHFTQGCPSAHGANRNCQDFFERVAARESHVRALFTEKVIQKIEKDVGCKIKMDENKDSNKNGNKKGKDGLCLAKGVDAVHKIKEEDKDSNKNGASSSRRSRSRSPDASLVGSRVGVLNLRSLLFLGHENIYGPNVSLADRKRLWKTMVVRICKSCLEVLHEAGTP